MNTKFSALSILLIVVVIVGCAKHNTPTGTAATGVQGTWQYKGVKYESKDGSKSDHVALMGSTLSLLANPEFTFDEKGGLKIYDPKEKNYRSCQYTLTDNWIHTTCDGNKGNLKVKQHKDMLNLTDTLNQITIQLERKK